MLDTDENQDLTDDPLSPAHKREKTDDEKFGELAGQFSPQEIANMEDNAINGAIDDRNSPQDKAEKDKIDAQTGEPDFFKQEAEKNEGKAKVRGFVSRNRGKIGLGALLLGGGGFGLFGMIAGPLQFMQIAKLLQGFHFASQEDLSDDRMMKIARYIRYKDTPEKTRLGFLGNKYADKLERRMNKSGIESNYSKTLGFEDGYIIDPNKIPSGSEINNIRGSPEEMADRLATHYDVPRGNIEIIDGKIKISSDGLGYFGKKKLIRVALQDAGYSKIGSAIRSRIMGKRGGVDWHPLKKLDRKVLTTLDARLKKWTADRENRVKSGNPDNTTLSTEDTEDRDGDKKPDAPSEDAEKVRDEANKVREPSGDTTPGTSKADADVAKMHSKIGAAAGASAVVGLFCLAQDLSNRYDDIKHDAVVLPLMRLGVEGMAVGNQIITGQDVSGEQMGFLAKKLYTDEDGSWAAARSIQAELGNELTGPDILPEAAIDTSKNVLAEVLDNPILEGICEVFNSAIGQIASFALDVFTGPFSALAGQAVSTFVAPALIDGFVRWLAGHPIDVNVAGANYGNYINYGAKLAANDSYISSGGTKLDPASTLELKKLRIANEAEARREKGLLARLFDPTDATSILGGFMSEQAPDPAQNIARVASSVPSSIASIFNAPFNFGQKKAKALSNYDYGFDDYGYSIADINREEIKNPFENEQEVIKLLKSSGGDDYRKRTEACFGIKLQSDGAVRSTGQVPKYKDIEDEENNCADGSLEWLRVRFYIMDSQLMEAYACYENDTEACAEFGLDGTASNLASSAISCSGQSKPVIRITSGSDRADWSNIEPSEVIGPMKVYIREACDTTNVKTIVIVASIHGSENGGQFVGHELLFNETLPRNIKIVVIPELNSSGLSASRRKNANGVDLNRNNDYMWRSSNDIGETTPSGTFYRGTAPGSEPETQAINSYLSSLGKVSLALYYHDNLNYVSATGNTSVELAEIYQAAVTGLDIGNENGVVRFSQQGSVDGWHNATTGSPALLVEMSSDQSEGVIAEHVKAIQTLIASNKL